MATASSKTKYIRTGIGLLLLLPACALVWNLFGLFLGLGKNISNAVVPFWLGLAAYFVFQTVFFRPVRTYVFGHELTHALAGILSGARLKSFKVSASGGSVVLTKTNVWIALAPYFLPIYTVALIALYRISGQFWPSEAWHPYFLFVAGFSLSFHFGLTHYALQQGQSDLKQFGTFYSMVVILLVSCLVLAGVMKLIFPDEINLRRYLRQSGQSTVSTGRVLYYQGNKVWSSFMQKK
jgi:hypothetical protein